MKEIYDDISQQLSETAKRLKDKRRTDKSLAYIWGFYDALDYVIDLFEDYDWNQQLTCEDLIEI